MQLHVQLHVLKKKQKQQIMNYFAMNIIIVLTDSAGLTFNWYANYV